MIRSSASRLVMAAIPAALLLSACDAANIVLWPWVESASTAEAGDASGLPPPPLVPVDPLIPVEDAPVIENPNANTGAPVDGTPFTDGPENPSVPISDSTPPVSAETGEPVVLPPPPTEDVVSGPAEPATPETPTTPAEPDAPVVPSFYYFRPGALEPGSGTGALEASVLVPDMAFPIKDAPAFPQSQVYRWGGGVKGGDQCDARNYAAPWRDNYCEKRSTSNSTPWCSVTGVHLGQDIRVGTPEGCRAERSTKAADRTRYEIVATEDGVISNVGSYSVTLRGNGRIYRYLHLNMAKLKVATGQSVKKGDVIGYVSNDFGGTPTTLHLHFEIKLNSAEAGWAYAPPYSSLLAAYQRERGNPGEMVADNFVVASSPR